MADLENRILVIIEGIDLPGRRCGPNPHGGWYDNIHVGVCTRDRRHRETVEVTPKRPWAVADLFPGDAATTRWNLEIIMRSRGGAFDFGGPIVRGKRGDRHVGLAWGEVPGDGTFRLFRGAKLSLDRVEGDVLNDAIDGHCRLVARVRLTDANGFPRCATVHPPDITWSASPP
jgi:hypothetical protein